ncbi:hypothetical protein [Hyphomonas sp.]|uniref:hypothetical protein n=1 Tax=Hyphomonas sp. TaxID=87 RepID=UPI003565949B
MPLGYPFYLWLKNNPAAQWALGIGAAIMGFFLWLALHDRRVRKGANAKAVKKAEKTATKELAKLEEQADERIEKSREIADAVDDNVYSDGVSDDTGRFLFSD